MRLIYILMYALIIGITDGKNIYWNGTVPINNNSGYAAWSNINNWENNILPSKNDTVIINCPSCLMIQCDIPIEVKSLELHREMTVTKHHTIKINIFHNYGKLILNYYSRIETKKINIFGNIELNGGQINSENNINMISGDILFGDGYINNFISNDGGIIISHGQLKFMGGYSQNGGFIYPAGGILHVNKKLNVTKNTIIKLPSVFDHGRNDKILCLGTFDSKETFVFNPKISYNRIKYNIKVNWYNQCFYLSSEINYIPLIIESIIITIIGLIIFTMLLYVIYRYYCNNVIVNNVIVNDVENDQILLDTYIINEYITFRN